MGEGEGVISRTLHQEDDSESWSIGVGPIGCVLVRGSGRGDEAVGLVTAP